MDRHDGEVCEACPERRPGLKQSVGPAVWRWRSGGSGCSCPGATGGSRRGSPRGAGIASLPWNQALVTEAHTPGKAQKGELEGRRHIYHHVTAPHNTCAHVREVYLPRARCGRPGTRAAGEKRGRQGRPSTPAGPAPDPVLGSWPWATRGGRQGAFVLHRAGIIST